VSLVSQNDGGESWQVGGLTSGNVVDFSLACSSPASSWAFAVDGVGQPVAAGSNLPPWGPYQLLVRSERFDYRPIRKRMVEGPIWVVIRPVERQFARTARRARTRAPARDASLHDQSCLRPG
jgi:hypothetical protein